ncbi:MAG: hypothetical protein K2I93_03990 [Oscillospiraceae bacterium]|nr:hypothetical protein [Oscillospiraceae bacterium]
MNCILCGEYIPDGARTEVVRRQNGLPSYYIKREVCMDCANPEEPGKTPRPARRMSIPNYAMNNAFELAGRIMKGVLRQYRKLYTDALREAIATGKTTGRDARAFIRFHRITGCTRYYALTLGKMDVLKNDARTEINKLYTASGCRFAVELLEKAMCEEENK